MKRAEANTRRVATGAIVGYALTRPSWRNGWLAAGPLAEDLDTNIVFTTARTDFSIYRIGKRKRFKIVP